MDSEAWVPNDVGLDKPSAARVYDYFLGGFHNFEIDRRAADMLLAIYPDARPSACACRAFLRRVVRFLVEQGVDQFLDIGSGIPTVGNVHEVAQAANPAARVVYVDIDPVAVAHSQAILKGNPLASAIRGDVRQPEHILAHPQVRRLLDLDRPVAILLLTLLHHVPDDNQAEAAVQVLRHALTPGGYLALSHGTRDPSLTDVTARAEALGVRVGIENRYRTQEEINRYFRGLELVEPGLVFVPCWRPEEPDDVLLDQPERSLTYGAVGLKTG